MTETITVRLSEADRRELLRHGKLSEVVRKAIHLYLQTKNSKRAISRLRELQRIQPRSSIQKDLELIRADRSQ